MKQPKPAIFGGVPVRGTKLSYGRQYIDSEDIAAVADTLNSDFLTCGPKVEAFEAELCQLTGAGYAAAVSNGTAALHVACLAAGIGPGDEVITTPITFAATANAVLYCGGTPVFADIDPETYEIDPLSIESKITHKTKAVIAVDFTGQACDYDAIRAVCRKHGLLLIEDAAHSIGTCYRGIPVGKIADLTTFSFHPVKTVTAGEGGAVLAQDAALAERVKLFARHGITREKGLLRDQGNSGWYYEQQLLGYNYRLTDLQCALAVSQLKKLDRFAARRRELAEQYDRFTRKEIYDALQAENIGVNVHYIPVYYFPYYQQLGYQKGLCPRAEEYYESCLTLPLFYSMTDRDQLDVVHAADKVIAYYRK